MHHGLSIYQTKYCKTTFPALTYTPILHTVIFNRPVVGKTFLRQKSQQTRH